MPTLLLVILDRFIPLAIELSLYVRACISLPVAKTRAASKNYLTFIGYILLYLSLKLK